MAAPVVKSFMFEAGATGMSALWDAMTRPLWTSVTRRLDTELCAIELLKSDWTRCSSVVPEAVGRAGAAAFFAGAFLTVTFFPARFFCASAP